MGSNNCGARNNDDALAQVRCALMISHMHTYTYMNKKMDPKYHTSVRQQGQGQGQGQRQRQGQRQGNSRGRSNFLLHGTSLHRRLTVAYLVVPARLCRCSILERPAHSLLLRGQLLVRLSDARLRLALQRPAVLDGRVCLTTTNCNQSQRGTSYAVGQNSFSHNTAEHIECCVYICFMLGSRK